MFIIKITSTTERYKMKNERSTPPPFLKRIQVFIYAISMYN